MCQIILRAFWFCIVPECIILFFDLEFLAPAEKGVKERVEVPPSLLKHPKQQKESLHELLHQEGQFDVNMKVKEH